MTGTVINVLAVLIGGVLGLLFGARLPERIHQTIIAALGLFTAVIGVQMFLKTQNAIIVLMSLLVGGLIGELLGIEDGLKVIGKLLEKRFASEEAKTSQVVEEGKRQILKETGFLRGFLTSSLIFCIGPMAILGSIQNGLTGDYSMLVIKATLDGFASIAFASSLGIGVLFSALMILIYQGAWSLLAFQAQALATSAMMNELTAVGGVILLGIAISSLLEIKPIRIGSLLPALLVAPVIVTILVRLGKMG